MRITMSINWNEIGIVPATAGLLAFAILRRNRLVSPAARNEWQPKDGSMRRFQSQIRTAVAMLLATSLIAASGLGGSQASAAPQEMRDIAAGGDGRELPASTQNAVGQLQQRVNDGTTKLRFRGSTGYLADILDQLGISATSQNLVFSKTSLQQFYINSERPRAIFFNDDVYVGYVADARLIELAVADPVDGTQYFVFPQSGVHAGEFVRQTSNCLRCHQSGRTGGVPGHIAQSAIVDKVGEPRGSAAESRVDHSVDLKDRWGGWYVTGTMQPIVHLGNLTFDDLLPVRPTEPHAGINLLDVSDRFDPQQHLRGDSDVVAMLVREHQSAGHNLLAKVIIEWRGQESQVTLSAETRDAVRQFARYCTFTDEAPLPGPVKGTSGFREYFESLGPEDGRGRSLRKFDLQTRIFKYPLSYLVYSESFVGLPTVIRDEFWRLVIDQLRDRSTSLVRQGHDANRVAAAIEIAESLASDSAGGRDSGPVDDRPRER